MSAASKAEYIRDHVVHCKRDPYDVYIGRGSKWGNPFVIGRDGDRDEVIAKYEQYLLNNDGLWSSLYELKGKVLGCWCSPAHCHGHLLVQYAGREINTHD